MHGEVHWIQKEPLTSEEEVLKDVPVFKNFVEICVLLYVSVKLCEKLLIVT